MIELGANQYKLILLDTNILREVVYNIKFAGQGFIKKFLCSTDIYIPCFSIYNVVELMPSKDIYENFIDFFSTIPCFMIYTAKGIVKDEYIRHKDNIDFELKGNIANAFIPYHEDQSYNLKKFMTALENNSALMQSIKKDIQELRLVADEWKKQRKNKNEIITKLNLLNTVTDDRYYKYLEYETIKKDLPYWGINIDGTFNLNAFPALRLMEYSHFNRIYMSEKIVQPNDVMDIRISSIVPYVDAVITEKFQANVYKKAKSIIPQLKTLEIYTLKDIRSPHPKTNP